MNTKKTEEKHYDIVSGPNRDVLFDACKYVCDEKVKLAVDFIVAIAYSAPKDDPGCAYIKMAITDIRITSIEHENGSGESFNLHGYCKADLKSLGRRNVTYESYRFKAYYNSKIHEGHISIFK